MTVGSHLETPFEKEPKDLFDPKELAPKPDDKDAGKDAAPKKDDPPKEKAGEKNDKK